MALRNDQYNQILREYDNRRFQNKHDQDKRIKEAYEKVPELKQLEEEMITLAAQSGRMALFGDNSVMESLKDKALDLKARQIELLLSNGYQRIIWNCNINAASVRILDLLKTKNVIVLNKP